MKTIQLIIFSAAIYGIGLVLLRGFFAADSTPRISLIAIPLMIVIIIIGRDLLRRATIPTPSHNLTVRQDHHEDPVEFLSGQIKTAATASNSYFENVVRTRLKELLIAKVALETGLSNSSVRRAFSDSRLGLKILHDPDLYWILYGPVPDSGRAKMLMVERAIDMIGAWKQ